MGGKEGLWLGLGSGDRRKAERKDGGRRGQASEDRNAGNQDPSTGSSEVCVSEGRDAEIQAESWHCWGEGDILALSNCALPCGKFPTEISQNGIIVRN